MRRYRSRSRSYSPRRASRSPPRRKRYDDPRDRYRGGRGYRDCRLSAPSGLLIRNIALGARMAILATHNLPEIGSSFVNYRRFYRDAVLPMLFPHVH